MARRSSNRVNNSTDYNFINVDFSLEDRLDINHWLSERKLEPGGILLELVEAGFKMSMSFDSSADVFSFTMTEGKKKERKGPLMVYFFKHSDFLKGLGVFYWFFVERLDKGDARYNETATDHDW